MNSTKWDGVPPKGRTEGVVESELPDELLVYDLERHRADALNRTAAPVWKACDGLRTVGEIAEAVGRGAGARVDARVVWLALERLSRARLLETPLRRPAGLSGLTRRDLARLGVGIALPAIVSILAPRALAQASDTCAQYGSQQECENPLKSCGGGQLFCRWRDVGGGFRCICTSS